MGVRPKVSVIMPVYNVENYLRQCLDSVINQTLRDIEIICIDDQSTDGSLGILKDYAAIDPRIRIITQKNAGAGAARNTGLKVAKGEYLSFLDSDDFFELDMLEKAYHACSTNNLDFVVFRSDKFDNDSKTYIPLYYSIRKDLLPDKKSLTIEIFPRIYSRYLSGGPGINYTAVSLFWRTIFIFRSSGQPMTCCLFFRL
jgi:glycosyltransferase involved in cell wall biosynthesis